MRKLSPIVKEYLVATPSRRVVRDQIEALLEALDGNKAAAARLLGVARRTVYNRLALRQRGK